MYIIVYQVNFPRFLMKRWTINENKLLLSAYLKQTSSNLTSYGDSTSFKNATKVGTGKKKQHMYLKIFKWKQAKNILSFFSTKQAGLWGFF